MYQFTIYSLNDICNVSSVGYYNHSCSAHLYSGFCMNIIFISLRQMAVILLYYSFNGCRIWMIIPVSFLILVICVFSIFILARLPRDLSILLIFFFWGTRFLFHVLYCFHIFNFIDSCCGLYYFFLVLSLELLCYSFLK